MSAYYNEVDPFAAHLLRILIAEGVIAPGDVDDRSIKEVTPDDLRGYTQCHFFAGGGLWSVAARLGGWPDDEPLWTGSCPCQPFSQAGKGLGTDDPRHLWPDFFRLVRSVRPPVVVGEQVAGAAGYGWLDGVLSDLAGEGYAGRGVDIPACSVDAPHIRQRLYWCAVRDVAHADEPIGRFGDEQPARQLAQHEQDAGIRFRAGSRDEISTVADAGRELGRPRSVDAQNWAFDADVHGARPGPMAYADSRGRSGRQETPQRGAIERAAAEWAITPCERYSVCAFPNECRDPNECCGRARSYARTSAEWDAIDDFGIDYLEHPARLGRGEGRPEHELRSGRPAAAGADASGVTLGDAFVPRLEGQRGHGDGTPGWPVPSRSVAAPNGSFWSDAEWLTCHDGKARRAKPGVRLLVDGLPGRVDLWRVAGNAIVPQVAAAVLSSLREVRAAA